MKCFEELKRMNYVTQSTFLSKLNLIDKKNVSIYDEDSNDEHNIPELSEESKNDNSSDDLEQFPELLLKDENLPSDKKSEIDSSKNIEESKEEIEEEFGSKDESIPIEIESDSNSQESKTENDSKNEDKISNVKERSISPKETKSSVSQETIDESFNIEEPENNSDSELKQEALEIPEKLNNLMILI
jgi:hypothetical protein